VANNSRMTLHPEDVRATLCLLGRGVRGGFFQGALDNLKIHSGMPAEETPSAPKFPAFPN